ncbi:uncharacterized protein LOC115885025 [Sitophilus oryzae]|uniref:Uncharacterized protein LOC115885025 n=1 Tax=Sitophilus oryzae TaxID=7048 RepID=A0A6J2Y712_SITOR|nr:uncharacterized protein LOC115885025 [Sitophilus oryzae]
MEVKSSPFVYQFQTHYKKILLLCAAGFSCYMMKRYIETKKKAESKKEKKTLKEFPSLEEIQKFIEDLPLNEAKSNKNMTLKDLLGELSEFSEDEDWKGLIASVHSLYEQEEAKECAEETGSVISIYEDPHIINLEGITEDIVQNTNVEKDDCLNLSGHSGYEGDIQTITNGEVQNLGDNDFQNLLLDKLIESAIIDGADYLECRFGNGDSAGIIR